MNMLLRDNILGGHIDNRQQRDLNIFRIYAEPFLGPRAATLRKIKFSGPLEERS